ncbi:hypothetical protein [Dickeya sp. NCPPB 3274]|uniref:hypothetical protein n=1 Tax=Dickeya sp. NCPPB 3274 TaxID=568766 RepID=UPI0019309FD3|nr:hypothetical protein [Dickeya sp. NCPPB 3274]
MPKFYYQIKGNARSAFTDAVEWVWPPIYSGLVVAPDRKSAKVNIEEEYGRQFPTRVLKKDIEQHHYLLHIREVESDNDFILRRFNKTVCKECGGVFTLIDKYNDPHADYKGGDYCSARCAQNGRQRDIVESSVITKGQLPAVIYQIKQKSRFLKLLQCQITFPV